MEWFLISMKCEQEVPIQTAKPKIAQEDLVVEAPDTENTIVMIVEIVIMIVVNETIGDGMTQMMDMEDMKDIGAKPWHLLFFCVFMEWIA
jgi:hypothetical protein